MPAGHWLRVSSRSATRRLARTRPSVGARRSGSSRRRASADILRTADRRRSGRLSSRFDTDRVGRHPVRPGRPSTPIGSPRSTPRSPGSRTRRMPRVAPRSEAARPAGAARTPELAAGGHAGDGAIGPPAPMSWPKVRSSKGPSPRHARTPLPGPTGKSCSDSSTQHLPTARSGAPPFGQLEAWTKKWGTNERDRRRRRRDRRAVDRDAARPRRPPGPRCSSATRTRRRRPEAAWDAWERRGVNQFRMLHYFLPRFREIVETELPELAAALDAAGALRINPIARDARRDDRRAASRRRAVRGRHRAPAGRRGGHRRRRGRRAGRRDRARGRGARPAHRGADRAGRPPRRRRRHRRRRASSRADLVVDASGRRSRAAGLARGDRRPAARRGASRTAASSTTAATSARPTARSRRVRSAAAALRLAVDC